MSATIPWSPVQLWKRHRAATTAGFLPPLLLLILLTTQASNSFLSDAIGEILFCFAWGLILAHVLAARRWLTASLVFVCLPAIALVALLAFVELAYAPEPRSSPTPSGPLDPSHTARPSPPDRAAPPREVPLPAPSPTRAPAPNLDPFRQYSRQLVDGAVGFDYQPKMRVGDRTDVNLRVSVKKAVQELRASLTRDGRHPIVEPAKVSSRMRAELRGFGFEFMPLSSVEQLIDADEDTTWTWDMRATEPGKHRLTVTLTAIVDLERTEGVRDVSTFYREVDVAAVPKTWWQNTRDVVEAYGPTRDVLWPAIPTTIAAAWAFLFARRKAQARKRRQSGFRHNST